MHCVVLIRRRGCGVLTEGCVLSRLGSHVPWCMGETWLKISFIIIQNIPELTNSPYRLIELSSVCFLTRTERSTVI